MINNVQSSPGIVFIPVWLKQALADNGKPLTAILDMSELRTFLTIGDIANFMYLNQRIVDGRGELISAFCDDFTFHGCSPYGNFSSTFDAKFFEDVDLSITLLKQKSISNIDISESVKSNLLPIMEPWEITAMVGEQDSDTLSEFGLFKFNTVHIHNNVYGICISSTDSEDSPEFKTYSSLDELIMNISQYYDFHTLVKFKTFNKYLKYMDKVN